MPTDAFEELEKMRIEKDNEPAVDTTDITVLVYGSLLRGLHNSHFLSSATLLLPHARTQSSEFLLIDSGGGYPYACHAADSPSSGYTRTAIVGELVRVSERTLASLDLIEGHPDHYKRELTPIKGWPTPAWVYVLAKPKTLAAIRTGTEAYREVAPPGDWRSYHAAQYAEAPPLPPAPEPLLGVGVPLPGFWSEELGAPHVHVLSGGGGGGEGPKHDRGAASSVRQAPGRPRVSVAERGRGSRISPAGVAASPAPAQLGTVVLAHGSAPANWLGNAGARNAEDAEVGGIAQLALRLQRAGLTVLVVDSFAGGRRERLGGAAGARKRVKDLEAALWFAKERSLPTPFHVYGKSNGGWVAAQMLHRAEAETLRMMASAVIQCPFLVGDYDGPQLAERAAGAAGGARVPPTLWLLASEDRMLEQYGEETLVAEAAARAMMCGGGEGARERSEVVVGEGGTRPCTCAVRLGETAHGAAVEVRCYSNVGHTFVMDERHEEITDGSSAPIVEHALARTVAWCLPHPTTGAPAADGGARGIKGFAATSCQMGGRAAPTVPARAAAPSSVLQQPVRGVRALGR